MPASKGKKTTTKKDAQSDKQQTNLPSTIELKDATISLQPSKRRTIRKIKVVLEGNLSINIAEEAFEAVKSVFEDYDYVDFYLKDLKGIDLSFIQLLFHLKKYYEPKDKHVTVDSDMKSDMRKIIVHAGFEDFMFIPKLV